MDRKLIRRDLPSGTRYYFWCPGCKCAHPYDVPRWSFNENFEKPTFTPSLRVFYTHPETKQQITTCHLFVTDGRIQFCGDCPHDLKGQTVDMQPIPDNYDI